MRRATSAGDPRTGPRLSDRLVDTLHRVPGWGVVGSAAGVMVAVWCLVTAVGGPPIPLVHLYYVAILLLTFRFGLRGAVVVGLVAGALSGPLATIPPSAPGDDALGWAVRCVMFVAVGAVLALALSLRDRDSERQVGRDVRSTLDRPSSGEVDAAIVARVPEVVADRAVAVVFQPLYRVADGALVAVEALARFELPGRPGPAEVFAAAHQAGRGRELELLAVELALDGAAGMPRQVDLCVNVSPGTLADPRLHDLVVRAAPRRVVLEVTEHAVIRDYGLLRSALARLADADVRIAVDDAGSGFASLRHVVQLEPDIIKLDLSLTQGVTGSPLRRALGESLAEFAHRAGALLVAEGVEDEQDLGTWAAIGADVVQGYAVGRPGPLPCAPVSDVVLRSVRRAGLTPSR